MNRSLALVAALAMVLWAAQAMCGDQLVPGSERPIGPPRGQGGFGGPFIGPGPGPGGPGPGGPGPMPPVHMFRPEPACPAAAVSMPLMPVIMESGELRLTEEQWGKLMTVMTKADEALRPLREKAAAASKELREAVLADNYDGKSVQELAARAQKAEAAVLSAELDRWAKIRSILTTEQMKLLREALNRMPGPMGPGVGPMFPGPMGPGPGGFRPGPGTVGPGPGPGPVGPESGGFPPGPMQP